MRTEVRNTGDLSRYVASNLKQIGSVMARHITPEKMARIALSELRNNAFLEKIAIQNPASFLNAIVQASHLGLEIGGTLGQAYLVPFKGEVKMMAGYRGLISLARRSGEITSINAEVVYSNDVFSLKLGINPDITHEPNIDGDRGTPKLAYMVAKFKDGGHHFEWMTIADVESVRKRSSAAASGRSTPWDTDYEQMVKKTVIRRCWKYLPMSIEMQSLEVVEQAAENSSKTTIDQSTGEIIIDQAAENAADEHHARVDSAIEVYAAQINKAALDATHSAELAKLGSAPESIKGELRARLTEAYTAKVAELTTTTKKVA